MSVFGWLKGCRPAEKIDYKAKLEHKILNAKQTPEPIFDLSDCNLKEVPSGVYSWCKVCLKEALLLQDNRLKSLDEGGNFKDLSHLKVLDLHNNQLTHLPEAIGLLTNLQFLYLKGNHLKNLPKSFSQLQKLSTLNISNNEFLVFPENICTLRRLQTLDISSNQIKQLPVELARVPTLDTLIFTEAIIAFPPYEICKDGLESIMRFLCSECNVDYIPPSKAITIVEGNETVADNKQTEAKPVEYMDDYWQTLERKKEEKRKDRLAMELLILQQQESQARVVAELQAQRSNLLDDVSKGQSRLEEELLHAQKKKDKSRQLLIQDLVEVEQHSDKIIEELLVLADRSENIELIVEKEKQERDEFEELFLKRKAAADELRRKDVLNAMTRILQEEQICCVQDAYKQELAKKLQEGDEEMNANVDKILKQKLSDQKEAVAVLLSEEQFQKEALIALMKAKDADSLQIRDQIYLIQDELTNLTMLELKQRDLKIEFQKELLEQKREILTKLLMQLIEQQKLRREEMQRRLREMEQQRLKSEQDYWLIQYQRLMDHKPPSLIELESRMDFEVRDFLVQANVQEYIPLFAKQNICFAWLCTTTAEQLREIGVHNPDAVVAILTALRARRKLERGESSESNREAEVRRPTSDASPPLSPTAPPDLSPVEELKTHKEVECVICMERQCCLLYLKCGHVCCCEQCGTLMTTCPLCRGEIVHRILLRYSE